jgi:hypothetical protein
VRPTSKHVALTWAARLKRVFGIEIEQCVRCGGRLKVIASIEEPELVERILTRRLRRSGRGRRRRRRCSDRVDRRGARAFRGGRGRVVLRAARPGTSIGRRERQNAGVKRALAAAADGLLSGVPPFTVRPYTRL